MAALGTEMNIYYCCFKILLFLALSSIVSADTTGNVRETMSLKELQQRGAQVSKVTKNDFDYSTVVINLDSISKCGVENFGVYIYENEKRDSILASVPVAKLNGTYEFFTKQSFLASMGLSIGCSHEGFFGYLEVPLKGL